MNKIIEIEKYFNIEKSNFEQKILDIKNTNVRLENENEKIEEKIIDLQKSNDEAYNLFSPNSSKNKFNLSEIDKLYKNKITNSCIIKENIIYIQELEKKYNEVIAMLKHIDELKKIMKNLTENNIFEDISKQKCYDTQSINFKESNCSKTMNSDNIKNIDNYLIDYNNMLSITENEFKRIENKIKTEIMKLVDNCIYKQNLSEKFQSIDVVRSQMELIEIKEALKTIKSKLNSVMFHVKHYENDETLYFKEYLSRFLKQYSNKCKININFKGNNIIMEELFLYNNLRIIDDVICNSIFHGNASIVDIEILIEKVEENQINNSNCYDKKININESDFNINNTIIDNINKLNTDKNYTDDSNTEKNYTDENNTDKNYTDDSNTDNNNTDDNIIDNNTEKNNIEVTIENNKYFKKGTNDLFSGDVHSMNSNNTDINKERVINFDLKNQYDQYDINIIISDNGYGFDYNSINNNNIGGLDIIKSRVKSLNGKISIQTDVGIGTIVKYNYRYIQKFSNL